MEFLGIGPLEFIFIVIIAVIVLGPKGMVKTAREVGKFIRKVVRSPIWRDVVDTSREIREFPRKIVREAGIEKDIDDLRKSTRGTFEEIDRFHRGSVKPADIEQIERKDREKGENESESS